MRTLSLMVPLWFFSVTVLAAPLAASKASDLRGALDDLTLAAANNGYQLVKVQPIDHALVKRGYANPRIRLAFIGKAGQVDQAMAANPALINILPLRLSLTEEADQVRVESDNLAAWEGISPETAELVRVWERELALILADYLWE